MHDAAFTLPGCRKNVRTMSSSLVLIGIPLGPGVPVLTSHPAVPTEHPRNNERNREGTIVVMVQATSARRLPDTSLGAFTRMYSAWERELDPIRIQGHRNSGDQRKRDAGIIIDIATAVASAGSSSSPHRLAHPGLSAPLAQVLEPDHSSSSPGARQRVELSRQFVRRNQPVSSPRARQSLHLSTQGIGRGVGGDPPDLEPAEQSKSGGRRAAGELLRVLFPRRRCLAVGLSNSNPIYHVPLVVLPHRRERHRLPQHTFVTPRIAEAIEAPIRRDWRCLRLCTDNTGFPQPADAYG